MTDSKSRKTDRHTTGTGSEQLPHAVRGAVHDVSNPYEIPLMLVPAIGENFEGNEVGAPFRLEPGKHAVFYCDEGGTWRVHVS